MRRFWKLDERCLEEPPGKPSVSCGLLEDVPTLRTFDHTYQRLAAGAIALCLALVGCAPLQSPATSFTVTSPGIVGGALAIDSTCDGAGTSPAIAWSSPPQGTTGYAIVMDHSPPEGSTHWYWLVWGIPADVDSLSAGATDTGYLGGNSVNPEVGYAPPCSQGPGVKKYTITVYALASTPTLPSESTASVTRESLLSSIEGITLSKATLDLTYSH